MFSLIRKGRRHLSSKKRVFPLEESQSFTDRKHELQKITIHFRCNKSDQISNLKTPFPSRDVPRPRINEGWETLTGSLAVPWPCSHPFRQASAIDRRQGEDRSRLDQHGHPCIPVPYSLRCSLGLGAGYDNMGERLQLQRGQKEVSQKLKDSCKQILQCNRYSNQYQFVSSKINYNLPNCN